MRLLKLDCEGAEWPILLTSRRLHLIDEIVGEFHEIGGPFLEIGEERPAARRVPLRSRSRVHDRRARRCLRDAGFGVTCRRHRRPDGALEGLGLFFAPGKGAPGKGKSGERVRPRVRLIAIGYNIAGTGLTRVMHSVMRRLADRHESTISASATPARSCATAA